MRSAFCCSLLLANFVFSAPMQAMATPVPPAPMAQSNRLINDDDNAANSAQADAATDQETDQETADTSSQALTEEEQNTYLNDQDQFEQAQEQAAATLQLEEKLNELKEQVAIDEKKLQADKAQNNPLAIEEDTKQLNLDQHLLEQHENTAETTQVHNLEETPAMEYTPGTAVDSTDNDKQASSAEENSTAATLEPPLTQTNTAKRMPW